MEGDKSYFNILKLEASKFAKLDLEVLVRSSSYARYESVDVVTAVLLRSFSH